MKIIEIKALENGSHRNQTSDYIKTVPEGYAVVPVDMETPNFPFGEVEVAEVEGIMTVTKWVNETDQRETGEEHNEIVGEAGGNER
jgi:hypothetical protein